MGSIQNWFWYLTAGFTVLPMVQKFVASVRRGQLIRNLEQERGSKLVMLVHTQPAGLLGSLFPQYINLNDTERIKNEIRSAGDRPIDLVVHTPGGLVLAATEIARVLHQHKAGVTVIVPQYAMSGGTLLALAGTEILMDELAMLGPIDPQLNGQPASAYQKVLRTKPRWAIADETIMMAHTAEKAVEQVQQFAAEMLTVQLGAEKARQVAEQLSDGHWTHDFPLHYEQLTAMGLNVSTNLPDKFRQLLALSNAAQSQAARTTSTKR